MSSAHRQYVAALRADRQTQEGIRRREAFFVHLSKLLKEQCEELCQKLCEFSRLVENRPPYDQLYENGDGEHLLVSVDDWRRPKRGLTIR